MFQFNHCVALEHNVTNYLTDLRLDSPAAYSILTFKLYTDLRMGAASRSKEVFNLYKSGDIPAALFNKTIGDLKKIGIVRTAKDSQYISLSDIAWAEYTRNPFNRLKIVTTLLSQLVDIGVLETYDSALEEMVRRGWLENAKEIHDPDCYIGIAEFLIGAAREKGRERIATDYLAAAGIRKNDEQLAGGR